MIRVVSALSAAIFLLFLTALVAPGWLPFGGNDGAVAPVNAAQAKPAIVAAKPPAPPPPVEPPPITQVLQSGVLIVISKASQRMYVFKDGLPWASSPVSTGKKGHATPAGVFPILQKKTFHRSNIYSNAPMPFMQRLTWSGIAIHSGHLPGYAASHGCVRLPHAFAKKLYALTRASATTVVITNQAVKSESYARTLALNTPMPKPKIPGAVASPAATALAVAPSQPKIVAMPVIPVQSTAPGQTIQLAAAASSAEAEAQWQQMLATHPELGGFQKTVIPAVVGSRQVYRLRATAPDAHAFCTALKKSGGACFNVS